MYGNHGNSDELKLVCPFAQQSGQSSDADNTSENTKPADDAIGFSHIFKTPGPEDRYRGLGFSSEGEIAATQSMLLHLSQQISSIQTTPYNTEDWENPDIPAGYTYLLQLVFHDLTQTASALPSIKGKRNRHVNLRRVQLELETIFGGGPDADPVCYEAPQRGESGRTRLKLGQMDMGDNKKSSAPDLDLRRIAASPDRYAKRMPLPDVLIADPRNDDNVILSQLTALFHHFHNAVLAKLVSRQEQADIPPPVFTKARSIVVKAYRTIILEDVLRRILHPVVYDHYRKLFDDGADFGQADVPLEFAHAVCRFGHAMIRPQYVVRDTPRSVQRVRNVVATTSSRRPHRMPLTRKWIVQWSKFFDMTGVMEGAAVPENFAARIGLHLVPALSTGTFIKSPTPGIKQADGLLYRDFIRGAAAGLWSVGALQEYLKKSSQSDILKQCDLLRNDPTRSSAIKKWLKENGVQRLSSKEMDAVAKDPPLLFYILFEASRQHDGRHLGILGSLITAEVMFSALARNPVFSDPSKAGTTQPPSNLDAVVFGGELPKTMGELIKFVADYGPSVPIV